MSYTTLWEVPDGLWEKMERILPPEKLAGTVGRPALANRQVLNGILFVLRSGCQWKGLKKEWYGASSNPIHLTDNSVPDFTPAWSADGRKIAFESHREGYAEI